MKVKTIEIAWHRRPDANHNDPVLSVDFLDDTIFATGGGDHEVKIWRLNTSTKEPTVEYCCSLKGHTQSVNVVRFSPNKKLLASAGDDGCIFVWGLREKVCTNWCDITKENCYWKKCIRGHAMDIYDICWCPNSEFLVSSGTDSNVIIWGIDGAQYNRIHDHSGYIQGIDWSQDDSTIISVANDRTARVYTYATGRVNTCLQVDNPDTIRPFRVDHRIITCKMILKKMYYNNTDKEELSDNEEMEVEEIKEDAEKDFAEISDVQQSPEPTTQSDLIVESPPEPEKKEGKTGKHSKGYFMFLGDTVPSFYRRPNSSHDGLLTIIPCGVYLDKEGGIPRNCSYMYLNGVFEKPICCLPAFNYPSVVCRFSPIQYKLSDEKEQGVMSLIGLPYYHVYAITTTEEVFIYSSNRLDPLYYVTNIHYAQICDFACSGTFAFTASSDGYCTLFQFEENELGERL